MSQGNYSLLPQIAILGAGGFVGSRMVEVFHLTGTAKVIPVVRRVPAMARLSRFDLDIAIADTRDSDRLAEALRGCSAVIDCTVGMPNDIEAAARALLQIGRAHV